MPKIETPKSEAAMGGSLTNPRAAIEAGNRAFMRKVAVGNAAGLAGLYTANGKLLPTHNDFVEGRPAIQKFWQAILDQGVRTAKLETLKLQGNAHTAYEMGAYTLCGAEDQVLEKGKYIVIWKQCHGEWKQQMARLRRLTHWAGSSERGCGAAQPRQVHMQLG